MTDDKANIDDAGRGNRWAFAATAAFIALAVVNALLPHLPSHERLWSMFAGAWIFSPILCGLWAAMGIGPLVMRLLTVLPLMGLAVLTPVFVQMRAGNMTRNEWIVFLVAGTGIFIVVTALVLVARRIAECRIARPSFEPEPTGFQFGMRQLLVVMTLWAVFFGMVSLLPFQMVRVPSHLGPEFLAMIVAIGSAVATALLLPILVIPWLMLFSRRITMRFLWLAVGFWAIMTFLSVAIWDRLDPHSPGFIFITTLCLQLGAAVAGAVTALPFRLAGFRVVSTVSPVPTQSNDIFQPKT